MNTVADDFIINEYIKNSPSFTCINWWEIPQSLQLKLSEYPRYFKILGEFTTVRRLLSNGDRKLISSKIIAIKSSMCTSSCISLSFPINLDRKEYARLFALMVSEGSVNTEFSLHVPEDFFHEYFKDDIRSLISENAAKLIHSKFNKGILRSRAPAILRYLIPVPEHIPLLILNNREYSREYLKVAFEAEGSPILNKQNHKRYIKLSRYVDITEYTVNYKIPLQHRIYKGILMKYYIGLYNIITDKPPAILKGEQVMLKKHFDIESTIVLEAIRKNKVSSRAGKVTARWVLLIYANNIDKFIKEIGFISERKKQITEQMKNIRSNNPQYSTLNLISKISDINGVFRRKDFINKMYTLGYKSPSCYLWRYCKSGYVSRVAEGVYKLIT